MVNSWIKNAQLICYPPRCLLCGATGDNGIDLCCGCKNDLLRIHNPCYQCGLPLTGKQQMVCGECLKKAPHFDHVVCQYIYQRPFSALVQGLKFSSRLQNARILAQLMVESLEGRPEPLPELLIPIPLHAKRTRERGFNQALELARLLSKQLSIDMDVSSCQRHKMTEAQSNLNAQQRRVNVSRAFSLEKPLTASHVAIIDDVMTTGSTVNALARLLKRAGVERVEVWVASRAL